MAIVPRPAASRQRAPEHILVGQVSTKRMLALFIAGMAAAPLVAQAREEVLQTLRKAVEFYRTKVSTEGGYHYSYADDLSYGRSESAEGPTQIEVQREATPGVGMALLEAWYATQDRFYLQAVRDAAHALVKGQLCSGGWDYLIEFDPAKRGGYRYRVDGQCGVGTGKNVTTLDDNTTQGALRLLMRADRELDFKDSKIHEAALYALDRLLEAQYPNGAWPQRFDRPPDPEQHPVKRASYPAAWSRKWPGPGYPGHYTLNDYSILDMIDAMLEAARIYRDPRYRASAEKGGGFILLAQMPEPQPAWAQQYDRDMHPAWARIFEPPAVTGGESMGVLRTLMTLYRETADRKYLEPIARALRYLRRSLLPVPANPSEAWRRASRKGNLVLARFYELETNRPLYITKGTRVTVRGGPATLVDGYQLSYTDESVITHYGVLGSGEELPGIEQEYERIAGADAASLARPDRLHGLSPWSETGSAERPSPAKIASILAALDARGAWTEEGSIGKSDRIVHVFAAKEMVLKAGGRVIPIKENDTVELFQGKQPPLERIIQSATFSKNVKALSAYLPAR